MGNNVKQKCIESKKKEKRNTDKYRHWKFFTLMQLKRSTIPTIIDCVHTICFNVPIKIFG